MTKAAPIAKPARPIDTSSVPAGNRIQVSPHHPVSTRPAPFHGPAYHWTGRGVGWGRGHRTL